MLTAERVRELFVYDPESGAFLRRSKDARRKRGLLPAGWTDPKGYTRIQVDGRSYAAHALAWLYVHGNLPTEQLDHVNGARSDNRIENLRECDTQENCAGRLLRKDNPTGFKGVSPVDGSFRARIRVQYRGIDLGRHPTAREAALAYDAAAVRYFGEFARTNAMLGLL